MSLLIWLPMNGNLNNRGISNVSVTNTSAASNDAGKIGRCYRFNKNAYLSITKDPLLTVTELSFCLWLKINSFNAAWDTYVQIGKGGTSWTDYTLGLLRNNTNSNLVFAVSDGSTSSKQSYTTPNITTGVWTHIACVYKSGHMMIYINGALHADNTTTIVPNFSAITSICVGGLVSSYKSDSFINDLRIYDHALSAKEVKEISKGLIIHYPLNSQYESSLRNKFSGDVASGLVGPGSFTRTKLADERGYNYKATRTGNGGNSWPSLGTSAYSFTAGKRYYYSVKVRCNKWTAGNFSLRASRSSNDWVTSTAEVCSASKADGKWHEYKCSQVVNETYDRSGSTVTCNPVLEFYASNQNGDGTVYDMDFDLKDVQVVESDVYVPFIQNEYAGTTIKDTSGYGNDAAITGTINIFDQNSARYDLCTFIAAGLNNYIKAPVFLNTDAITMNVWLRSKNGSSGTGGYHMPLNIGDTAAMYEMSIGTDGKFRQGFHVNGSRVVDTTESINLISDKAWHMITATFDGSNIKRYVDGTLVSTHAASGTLTGGQQNLYIGRYGTSGSYGTIELYESDIRVYCTALSADDIKELYNNGASISNNGSVMCYQFSEQ